MFRVYLEPEEPISEEEKCPYGVEENQPDEAFCQDTIVFTMDDVYCLPVLRCTLKPGHTGCHVAHDKENKIAAKWDVAAGEKSTLAANAAAPGTLN
jgi:hypothetical protein